MVFYLLESDYDAKINRAVLIFYDTEKNDIFRFVDNTGFRPYCLTDLEPDSFYFRCLNQAKQNTSNRILNKNDFVLELLAIDKVGKFNTIKNKSGVYYKIYGKTPLDIAGKIKKGSVNISQYLHLEEEQEEMDDEEDEIEEEEEDHSNLSQFVEQKPKTIINTISNAWENSIQFKNCYVYDKGYIYGMPYKFVRKTVDVVEPKPCDICNDTMGVFKYSQKLEQFNDNDKGFLLTEIQCKKCGTILYLNKDYAKHKYIHFGTVIREFDFIQKKKKVLVPELIEEKIDESIVNDIMSAFIKNEPKEIQNYAKLLIPLFFYQIPYIKRQAMDIEVLADIRYTFPTPKKAKYPVNAITFVTSEGKHISFLKETWKEEGELFENLPKNIEIQVFANTDEGEKKLLLKAFEQMKKDPVLITYNGDSFDMPYLYQRALNLGIKKEAIPFSVYEKMGERFKKVTVVQMKDQIHIDLIHTFRNPSLKAYAFGSAYRENTLDSVSEALLKKTKAHHLIVDEKGEEKYLMDYNKNELLYYNWYDTSLTLELTTYDDNIVIQLAFMLMRLSKSSLYGVFQHKISFWLKNMIDFYHRSNQYLIPRKDEIASLSSVSTKAIIDDKQFKGAYVVEPIKGIHFGTKVLDFASLYPSVMKVKNISYETIDNCDHEDCKKNIVPETTHWICQKRLGIFPIVIGTIRGFRVYYFKKKAKSEKDPKLKVKYKTIESVLKVFINGFYGTTGSLSFYYFLVAVAESVTAYGRFNILSVIDQATKRLIQILYGDTDSTFLDNPKDEDVEFLIKFAETQLGVELELDKTYKFIAMSNRKKNYMASYNQTKGGLKPKDGKWIEPDLKGLSGKKSNIPDIIKTKFKEVVSFLDEKIVKKEDIPVAIDEMKKMIKEFVMSIRLHKVDINDLIYAVKLNKDPISGYKKSLPQHVRCARMLMGVQIDNPKKKVSEEDEKKNIVQMKLGDSQQKITRHIEEGDYVNYIKTTGKHSALPVEFVKDWNNIDIKKYISQIETVFVQLLDCFDVRFDQIVSENKTLDGFIKKK